MIFSTAKIYVYGAIAGVILIAGIAAFWYWNWSQEEIATLKANNAQLETAVQENEQTIAALKADGEDQAETLRQTNEKFQDARRENNRLKEVLGKHNIGYLATQKPKLIEKAVNRGTDHAGRCMELLSGAEHTKSELAATKRSQVNTICPEVANPNFKAKQ
jgi:hypothetical protein